MLNWITAHDHILVPISRSPYPAPCDTEIAGVTGGTLPNGVLTDRVENQIKKAGTTFELGRQGAHSPQQQGQDQSDECPTFRTGRGTWTGYIWLSAQFCQHHLWAVRGLKANNEREAQITQPRTTANSPGWRSALDNRLLVDYASLPGRQENNCLMVTQNGINISRMSVRKSLKNPVKYHSKWYSQAVKKKSSGKTEKLRWIWLSVIRKWDSSYWEKLWENMIPAIKVTSVYESRVERVVSHLAVCYLHQPSQMVVRSFTILKTK